MKKVRPALRLQALITKTFHIDVEVPFSLNRGYWQRDTDAGYYRWVAYEIGGERRTFYCSWSMKLCLKHGLHSINVNALEHYEIDINPFYQIGYQG